MEIHKQYLTGKVNPILEPMITALLATKPQDPVGFIIDWLENLQSPSKSRVGPLLSTEHAENKSEDKKESKAKAHKQVNSQDDRNIG